MNDAFVTIERFWEPSRALFLQTVLEGHGIPAWVNGQCTASIFPKISLFKGSVQGGITLQVRAEDESLAHEVLAGDAELDEAEELEENTEDASSSES